MRIRTIEKTLAFGFAGHPSHAANEFTLLLKA